VIVMIFSAIGVILLSLGSGILFLSGYLWIGFSFDQAGGHLSDQTVLFNPAFTPQGAGAAVLLIWSGGLLISGLQFLALGSVCRLMIQLEANTRATAELLSRMVEPPTRSCAKASDPESFFLT
jgi:hypothetical protein